MSIVKSSAGGAALPGTVSLFASHVVPDGYERLQSFVAPPDVFAASRRVVLLDNPLGVNAPDYHWFNDTTSVEHVYAASGTSLYRVHLPTGMREQLPPPPKDLGTGGAYVAGTPVRDGAVFYAVGSTASSTMGQGLYFNCNTRAWTSIAAPSFMGVILAPDTNTGNVYLLGGYRYSSTGNTNSQAVQLADLTANTLTAAKDDSGNTITLPTAASSGQGVLVGRKILFFAPSLGLRSLDLGTGITDTLPLPAGPATSVASLTKLDSKTVLFVIAGSFYTMTLGANGVWTTTTADVAGVGLAPWRVGVRGAASLTAQHGWLLAHYDPTTAADSSLLGLLMLDGLSNPPNASVFYARKL